jgi:hypothetical protein
MRSSEAENHASARVAGLAYADRPPRLRSGRNGWGEMEILVREGRA